VNEGHIQLGLWHMLCNGSAIVIPNSTTYGWESDLLRVTKSLYVYEFEIKTSRADYRRDFHKDRHKALTGQGFVRQPYRLRKGPNYFIYVLPKDLVPVADVPEWAGLIWWSAREHDPHGYWNNRPVFETVRKPKKRHGEKVSDTRLRYMERGMCFRFWNAHQTLMEKQA